MKTKQKPKNHQYITQIWVFFTKSQKTRMEIIAFCGITFGPIKAKTCSAPQNDQLNLSFVKYIRVDGENLA